MMDCLTYIGRSATPFITRSILLLMVCLLFACDGQTPSQINPDAYADRPQLSPQQQAEAIGEALGVEQAKPALTETGEALLEVSALPLMYSDGGLLVDLDGQVIANGGTQISRTMWRQTLGPQAQLLNPDRPQAQVIVPRVTTATHLEFTLMAVDTQGHVAEALTRIRVLASTSEPASPELAQLVAQHYAHNAGAGEINVTLSLPEPPNAPITLHYSTQDSTAIAGQDYRAAQGQVTLDADNPEALIPIEVLTEAVIDGDIYFRLLYSPDPTSIPNQYLYVVLSAQAEQSGKPEEDGEPIEPTEPPEPTEPEKPSEPGEPAEPAEPVEPSEPTEPTEPLEPPEPTEPTEPAEPEPTSYSITYTAGQGGRIQGEAEQIVDVEQRGSPVTAIAEPGYIFTAWSDGLETATRTDSNLQANLQVTAQFRRAESWLAAGHHGELRVQAASTSATIIWPEEAGVDYNLIVSQDPFTELENYSAYGAELLTNVKPPLQLTQLATEQPVYLALEANGQLHSWTSFVPRAMGTDHIVDVQAIGADGTRYVGGRFSFVGPFTGAGVTLPAGLSQASHPLAGARIEGEVYSVVPDGQGGWYLGGDIQGVDGQARQNLAHINAARQLTDWSPEVNRGAVRTLAIDQGVIYVGGEFNQAGSEARSQLAAFDAEGQLLPWNPGASGMVSTLAIYEGVIYAGGEFTQAGGEERSRLAAFDAQGQLLTWNPGVSGTVRTLAIDQGIIYAGGLFTQVDGEARPYLAAFDVQGQLLPWNPRASLWGIYTLAVDQGVIYAGGAFTQAGGEPRSYLAAFDAQGQLLPWNPGVDGSVRALAVDQGVIYAGGGFTHAGGEVRSHLAAFDTQGHLLPWNPGANSSVESLAIDQGLVYAGGTFAQAGGEARSHLAAFGTQGQLLPWNPGTDNWVATLAVDQGVIYAGGRFTQAGGEPRSRLAAFDAQGQLLPWNPGASSFVNTLAVDQGVVYVGGWFAQAGGEPRSRLAAFDAEGQLLSWNPGANSWVNTLAVDQGVIYAGGNFLQAGGETRAHLAAFDAQGQLLPWNPGTGGTVSSLTVDQTGIYATGGFLTAGGEPRNYLAAFDAEGQLLSWRPRSNNSVRVLTAVEGVIYAGGLFTGWLSDENRMRLAALDSLGRLLPWNPEVNGSVNTVVVDQGVIYVGGDFTQANGELRSNLAAFDEDGKLLDR